LPSLPSAKLERFLLSNDLHQDALAVPAIKFTVEDLLPQTKVKFTICDRNYHLMAHYLAFHMGISLIFTGVVVAVINKKLSETLNFDSQFTQYLMNAMFAQAWAVSVVIACSCFEVCGL